MGLFKRIKSLLSDRYVLIMKEEWFQMQQNVRELKSQHVSQKEWLDVKKSLADAERRLNSLPGLPTAAEFESLRSLAEQANILCEGMMPDSGITARKVGNLVVTTGIPNQG